MSDLSKSEINKTTYVNDEHRLRVNLLLTSGWLKNKTKEFLDQFEVTQQQFNILKILNEVDGDPLSTNEICDEMIDKSSDTSRIVDRLVVKGLVTKKPSPIDRRKVQVFISSEGKYLLSTIDTKLKNLDAIFENLSEKETIELNDLLEKVIQ